VCRQRSAHEYSARSGEVLRSQVLMSTTPDCRATWWRAAIGFALLSSVLGSLKPADCYEARSRSVGIISPSGMRAGRMKGNCVPSNSRANGVVGFDHEHRDQRVRNARFRVLPASDHVPFLIEHQMDARQIESRSACATRGRWQTTRRDD